MDIIKQQLLKIRDDAFCAYTLPRARRLYEKIKDKLEPEIAEKIIELIHQVGNPDNCPKPRGWGSSKDEYYQRACVNLAEYINKICEVKNEHKRGHKTSGI